MFSAVPTVKLCDLFQLAPEIFPPEHLLSDEQLSDLIASISHLWTSWNLRWEMPPYLPERKKYVAMVREMGEGLVRWSLDTGGDVAICRPEMNGCCPFGPEDGYCFCKHLEESARLDLVAWEEHLRSQGYDPYEEISAEDEANLEREIIIRELMWMYGDDWEKFADADLLNSGSSDLMDNAISNSLDDLFFSDLFFEDFDDEVPPGQEDV